MGKPNFQQDILKHIDGQSGSTMKEVSVSYFQKMGVCLLAGNREHDATD